jgi:hypothetical protein
MEYLMNIAMKFERGNRVLTPDVPPNSNRWPHCPMRICSQNLATLTIARSWIP